jgi:hypothetical protein
MVRNILAGVAILVAAAWLPAQAGVGAPSGWFIAGSAPADYEMGTEHVAGSAGKQSAYIKAKPGAAAKGFGTLMQTISAEDYVGQRVRLSARMRTEKASGFQLWFRVDGQQGKMLRFYNMQDRPVTGTTDWKRYEIVLDVPPDSTSLNYGFFLQGGQGEGWSDSVALEQVDKTTPVSELMRLKKPTNLNFDQ